MLRLLSAAKDQRRQPHRQVFANRLPGFVRHLQRRLLEYLHTPLMIMHHAESGEFEFEFEDEPAELVAAADWIRYNKCLFCFDLKKM